MTKEKKIPKRLCVACREMKEKGDLIRITKSKDGIISLDVSGKAPGRGAYICKSKQCLLRAEKTRALERTFSQSIDKNVYLSLSDALAEVCDE